MTIDKFDGICNLVVVGRDDTGTEHDGRPGVTNVVIALDDDFDIKEEIFLLSILQPMAYCELNIFPLSVVVVRSLCVAMFDGDEGLTLSLIIKFNPKKFENYESTTANSNGIDRSIESILEDKDDDVICLWP